MAVAEPVAPQADGDLVLLKQLGSGWVVDDKGNQQRTPLNAGSSFDLLRKQLPANFLRFNLVTRLPEAGGVPITDGQIELLYVKAQSAGWQISKAVCKDAVWSVAYANQFDPVQDYLNVVAADPNLAPADINKVSTNYLETSDPLFDLYLKVALVGAVKRRFEPGCKFDTVPTLDGDGGIGKSEFWITLASPEWHSSSDAESEKDFLLILHSCWIYEQAELDYITGKRAVGSLKNLVTTRRDSLRVPFGTGVEQQDRRGIMSGTVNGPFLRGDAALRRRFMVIQCPQRFELGERIDIERLRRDRDAIWKAAVLAYRDGAQCFLDPEEAAAASQKNLEIAEDDHPWTADIQRWLKQPSNSFGPHHTNDILRGARLIPADRAPSRQEQMALGCSMQQVGGWSKDRTPSWEHGVKARWWRKTGLKDVPSGQVET